jgi:preprotein translocase subunit SecY
MCNLVNKSKRGIVERAKILKILGKKIFRVGLLLGIMRIGLYLPIGNIDLDLVSKSQVENPLSEILKNVVGGSSFSFGYLGLVPYLYSKICVQVATPFFPVLKRLREEGGFGRRKITRYTRYVTVGFALWKSTLFTLGNVEPLVFNWSGILAFQIILSLVAGSMTSMWIADLITKEDLGSGPSMIILVNSLEGYLANGNSGGASGSTLGFDFAILCVLMAAVVELQESYMPIEIISAKQLVVALKFQKSYIPLKLNQAGVMPIIFNTALGGLFSGLFQRILIKFSLTDFKLIEFGFEYVALSLTLLCTLWCTISYSLLTLNPREINKNLEKMAWRVAGTKQGEETVYYLGTIISRLALLGGASITFLASLPYIAGNVFKVTLFRDLSSLIILVGVVADVISHVQGYLLSDKYENPEEKRR